METLAIASDSFERSIDFFQLVFLHRYSQTLLPEVFDVMLYLTQFISEESGVKLNIEQQAECARRAMLRFVDIFAGCRIEVPSKEQLSRCIRDVDIYLILRRGGSVRLLAQKYELVEETVRTIYAQVKRVLENRHGISVKGDK